MSVVPLMMHTVTTRGGDKPNHWVTMKLKRSIKLKWPAIDSCKGKQQLMVCRATLLRNNTHLLNYRGRIAVKKRRLSEDDSLDVENAEGRGEHNPDATNTHNNEEDEDLQSNALPAELYPLFCEEDEDLNLIDHEKALDWMALNPNDSYGSADAHPNRQYDVNYLQKGDLEWGAPADDSLTSKLCKYRRVSIKGAKRNRFLHDIRLLSILNIFPHGHLQGYYSTCKVKRLSESR